MKSASLTLCGGVALAPEWNALCEVILASALPCQVTGSILQTVLCLLHLVTWPTTPAILTIHFARRRDIDAIRTIPIKRRRCSNHTEVPVKALAISLVTGVALCGIMSASASAMPMSNVAAAATDLKLGQSVRYVCGKYRCWWRPDYYYGYAPSYYTWYGYAPGYRGFWW